MKPNPILEIPDPNRAAVLDRIFNRSAPASNGCIEWGGALDKHGYGKFRITLPEGTRTTGPHRMAWLAQMGPIASPALVIDHLCRNRRCVNTRHMELVTVAVNTLRGDHSNKAGRSGRPAGRHGLPGCGTHGQSDGYFWQSPQGETRWACRPCAKVRRLRYRARVSS